MINTNLRSARRLASGAAAVIVACGGMALAASGASAATAAARPAAQTKIVAYKCKIPVLGTRTTRVKILLTAPATAKTGATVPLKVAFSPTGLPSLKVTHIRAASTLAVSGAQRGSVAVVGTLPSGNTSNLKLILKGKLHLTHAGKVLLSPGRSAVISVMIGKTTFTFSCQAPKKVPVLGSIKVTKRAAAASRPAGRL